jgi:succinate dehydrogenase/fumarate reductase flavoprotein subunit
VIQELDTDVLILGAGGAGLTAALHAADASPRLRVTIVVKGLLGRAGCTRMVQGGYNAVLTTPTRSRPTSSTRWPEAAGSTTRSWCGRS